MRDAMFDYLRSKGFGVEGCGNGRWLVTHPGRIVEGMSTGEVRDLAIKHGWGPQANQSQLSDSVKRMKSAIPLADLVPQLHQYAKELQEERMEGYEEVEVKDWRTDVTDGLYYIDPKTKRVLSSGWLFSISDGKPTEWTHGWVECYLDMGGKFYRKKEAKPYALLANASKAFPMASPSVTVPDRLDGRAFHIIEAREGYEVIVARSEDVVELGPKLSTGSSTVVEIPTNWGAGMVKVIRQREGE